MNQWRITAQILLPVLTLVVTTSHKNGLARQEQGPKISAPGFRLSHLPARIRFGQALACISHKLQIKLPCVKLLASGSVGVALALGAITCIATVLDPWLYNKAGNVLAFVRDVFDTSDSTVSNHLPTNLEPTANNIKVPGRPQARRRVQVWRLLLIFVIATIGLLQIVRPKRTPFDHLSVTLPFTLYQIFDTSESAVCGGHLHRLPFPKPELVYGPNNGTHIDQLLERPFWLPEHEVVGFDRWYSQPQNESAKFDGWRPYDMKQDPLKISNLDNDLFQSLRNAFDTNNVLIKHVVLFHLESTRQDAFPLTNGSHLHEMIAREMGPFADIEDLDSKLASISLNAAAITGLDTGLEQSHDQKRLHGWRSQLEEGLGGISVAGTLTTGTATLKSLIGSVCGAAPLPVDFTEEAALSIYQPCFPHVLNMLSDGKNGTHVNIEAARLTEERDAVLSRPWVSVHAQAITDQFDRQDVLNTKMGFGRTIARAFLRDPESKYFPPSEPESNYFGYPEPVLKPYLRDLFLDAEKAEQRLFLSHLTSTTHHPWHVPESYAAHDEYLSRRRWGRERPLNGYLNTLRYQDQWIGDFMDLLEELDVLNETLVVFAGDHGMAFREDAEAFTTFENPHIVNFRVPLMFFHPRLPRLQLDANASTLSILPTILDLLSQSGSLDTQDNAVVSQLLKEYEGQSLLRPYVVEQDGREAWHFSVVNAGAAMLSVGSASVPWRLVMPLCREVPYRFTHLADDPSELRPVESWTIGGLSRAVELAKGPDAAAWVRDAEQMGLWWASEQKQKWRYTGASLQDDKAPGKHQGVGRNRLDHWWNT
ncbi:uncharacterized protein HMPREF1541_06358 [Cyphellophora europaea CBS 101466]|uniref:Sulfatase N-terminal domain-containing protein n=1 Tax=Cyphellophora europaea (strain CBS 101466) TaxID=1220924 RepID=W2RRH1_CYPE1|nr:uncharacterized protein HMPREF1541_06358 [Cyphellophora europaea CBS 101466]ETN38324.1 hypothetical protein HMPREF1541_06358 [Cyphellophora europaea CBS 101466]